MIIAFQEKITMKMGHPFLERILSQTLSGVFEFSN